jgi:hypothetical protein
MLGPCTLSKYTLVFATSDKWGPHVVNWMQTSDLSELQRICEKVVDFGSKNIKWYETVYLTSNGVVLC